MIDPKELRIGNKIAERDNHRIYEVKNILLNRVVVQYWSCGEVEEIHFSKLMPIPLTSKILERCGFEKYPNPNNTPSTIFDFNDFKIIKSNDSNTFSLRDIHKSLKYLHQLQNLYFALTGEELKIIILFTRTIPAT